MKTVILFLISLTHASAFGKGYSCSAYCLEVDTVQSTVTLIGRMNVMAGVASRKEAHKALERKCRSNSRGGMGLLTDMLDFRSGSTTHHGRIYHGYRFEVLGYYHEHRELDVKITPSKPSAACEVDNDVADGEIPYTGNLDVL